MSAHPLWQLYMWLVDCYLNFKEHKWHQKMSTHSPFTIKTLKFLKDADRTTPHFLTAKLWVVGWWSCLNIQQWSPMRIWLSTVRRCCLTSPDPLAADDSHKIKKSIFFSQSKFVRKWVLWLPWYFFLSSFVKLRYYFFSYVSLLRWYLSTLLISRSMLSPCIFLINLRTLLFSSTDFIDCGVG